MTNGRHRNAIKRLLKLASAQVSRIAFNANLADKHGATSPECVRASKERKQLLADIETLTELVKL